MPPFPRRLFVSIDTVERMAATVEGHVIASSYDHLLSVTLGGRQLYAVSYIRSLLQKTRRLSQDTVRKFNASKKGQQAIADAKREFEDQLRRFGPYSDQERPSKVTVQLLATTFLTERAAVELWCEKGVVPHHVIDGQYYFEPDELLRHFQWSQ